MMRIWRRTHNIPGNPSPGEGRPGIVLAAQVIVEVDLAGGAEANQARSHSDKGGEGTHLGFDVLSCVVRLDRRILVGAWLDDLEELGETIGPGVFFIYLSVSRDLQGESRVLAREWPCSLITIW